MLWLWLFCLLSRMVIPAATGRDDILNMKIYTKTGDSGQTSLFGGTRVSKSHAQVEAYGVVDELTSLIGVVIVHLDNSDHVRQLTEIQKQLYHIMSILSGYADQRADIAKNTAALESAIDAMESTLPKLNRFILPQGTAASTASHMARAVCRRGERAVVTVSQQESSVSPEHIALILQYLNRLSDYLFVFARVVNKGHEVVT